MSKRENVATILRRRFPGHRIHQQVADLDDAGNSSRVSYWIRTPGDRVFCATVKIADIDAKGPHEMAKAIGDSFAKGNAKVH